MNHWVSELNSQYNTTQFKSDNYTLGEDEWMIFILEFL